jgi:hypothetical protein
MDGDAILWISLILVLIVIANQYRPTLAGMLFDPNYTKAN